MASTGSESLETNLKDVQECFNMPYFRHLSGSEPAKIEGILGCYGTVNSHIPGVAPNESGLLKVQASKKANHESLYISSCHYCLVEKSQKGRVTESEPRRQYDGCDRDLRAVWQSVIMTFYLELSL